MNQTNHQPIKTLALASGLSLAGTVLFYDCLFQGAPLGTNVPIFFLLFYAALLCCYGPVSYTHLRFSQPSNAARFLLQ